MLRRADIERMRDEDLSEYRRDVLEFNFRQLAKGVLDRIDATEEMHRQDMARLRELIDTGAHVAVLLAQAQRQGRKTVRIADVLDEAHRRMAENGDAP